MNENIDISREDVQTMKSVAEGAEGAAPEDVAVYADTNIDDPAVETVLAAHVMGQRPPVWARRQVIIQEGGEDQ